MYVGIDIGGTKTLVASLTDDGVIVESAKFPTPKKYEDFLPELAKTVASFTTTDFRAGCVAAPGVIDRKRGVAKSFGNLAWHEVHLQKDVERITRCPMLVENDANLAGLSEAMLVDEPKVLYLTVSTGIGSGFIVNKRIEPSLEDSESGQMLLQRGDKLVKWESFASGRALAERYGKQASELEDPAAWSVIAKDLSLGMLDLIAVFQPDVIILGGGVGRYLEKFHHLLVAQLKQYETPLVQIPPIRGAKRPDEAVVYGCYDLAKAHYA
jgi:predicted NBD/HSP70 family sugar kinase